MKLDYNPEPYRGRPTDSHKRKGGGGKPPKKSSGSASRGIVGLAFALFVGIPVGVVILAAYVALTA